MRTSEREQKQWNTHCQDREHKPQTTERKDRDGYKSSDKDRDRNCMMEYDRSKKSDNQHMVQNGLVDALRNAETTTVSASTTASARDRSGHESPYRQPQSKAEMRSEHQSIARLQEVAHS